MNAASTFSGPSRSIAPTCSVLSILVPVAGRWIGCQGVNCTQIQTDPRALIQFAFCLGGTVFLGIVLAVIADCRKEPLGARLIAMAFQCVSLAWLVAMVMR